MKIHKIFSTANVHQNIQKDFEWAFNLNKIGLQMLALWPESDKNDRNSLSVRFRIPFILFLVSISVLLPQIYALVIVINNLPLVTDNLMTSSAAISTVIKLFFMWWNKDCLKPVVDSIAKDWSDVKHERELGVMKRHAGKAKIFTIIGIVFLFGVYASFVLTPLLGLNIRIINNLTDYGDRYLIAQSYFPFDYSPSPIFELVYVLQLSAGFFLAASVCIPDTYFVALIFHFSAQFEILGLNIEKIILKNAIESLSISIFNKKLRLAVSRHVHLLRSVYCIESAFSCVIVVQVCCMTAMVVCLSFQLLQIFNTNNATSLVQLFTLIATLITLMMFTFVDCLACEILMTRTAGICQNVYHCTWYNLHKKNIRNLIPIMIVSKKARYMRTGKIFELSLKFYGQVLRSVVGYISVLIAVTKE